MQVAIFDQIRIHTAHSLMPAVACWVTDQYHLSSNLGVGITEGCFIFDFASLPSYVARPI